MNIKYLHVFFLSLKSYIFNAYSLPCWAKITFRFFFCLILSFILLKNNGAFPFIEFLNKPLIELFKIITPWFSENILGYNYDFKIFTNGSGDTSYDWVSLLILFLISVMISILWSIIDIKRRNYNMAYYWLTVFIRYYIAFMLINYGAIKLIHAQMPPPSLNRLMEPLHEFSPMGLAWTYLGFSKSYNIFMGIVEILSGLLLFRRTMIIGALITIATSINIMTVNYFFDVPVKMVSTALFLLSLFLLLPYMKAIFTFLMGRKATRINIPPRPTYKRKNIGRMLLWVKIIVLVIFTGIQIFRLIQTQNMIAKYFKKSPLYGIYKVQGSDSVNKTIPKDWSYIIFEFEGKALVRNKYYEKSYKDASIDTLKKEITFNNYLFNYTQKSNGDLTLVKDFPNRKEEIKLIKQKIENYELNKYKFNLIQEYPNNQ